jgi:hypothetical protein
LKDGIIFIHDADGRKAVCADCLRKREPIPAQAKRKPA